MKTLLAILLLAAAAHATDLPYAVENPPAMQNDEFLYQEILRLTGALPCPTGYVNAYPTTCVREDNKYEDIFSSSPQSSAVSLNLTTSTPNLLAAQARAVRIRASCTFTNNSGSSAGIDLFISNPNYMGAISQLLACSANTGVSGQEAYDSKVVLIDLDDSFNLQYSCRPRNSTGSASNCYMQVEEILR